MQSKIVTNGKEITILYMGMTQSGKTSIIASHSSIPEKVSKVCAGNEKRTPVTTDWKFEVENEERFKLSEIELKEQEMFKNDYSHSVEGYNYCIKEGKNKDILTKVFGFKPLDENADVNIDEYVKNHIDTFIKNSSEETIIALMQNRNINKVVTKITIDVPPSKDLKRVLKSIRPDKIYTLIIRDTRGFLDINEGEEADLKKINTTKNKSSQDLGLGGIDGAVLLGSSVPFPIQVGEWYKEIYSKALEAVPIFIASRYDSLYYQYKTLNKKGGDKVKEFLNGIPNYDWCEDINYTHFRKPLELLKTFRVATYEKNKWDFVHNPFDLNECEFLIPTSSTLSKFSEAELSKEAFNTSDYAFFQKATLCNLEKILNMTIQNRDMMDSISENVSKEFKTYVRAKRSNGNTEVCLLPNSSKYTNKDVNNAITTQNQDYLGPLGGITTHTWDGNLKYLAAATLAVSSYYSLYYDINDYMRSKGILKDSNGNEIAKDVTSFRQKKFICEYLRKKLIDSSDQRAYLQNHIMTDRSIAVQALKNCHDKKLFASGGDALTIATLEVLDIIY